MSESHGKIVWSELMTRDVDAAKKYYSAICGWVFQTVPSSGGDYHIAMQDGQPVAGIMDITNAELLSDAPPNWFTYLGVADVDATVERTKSLGGKIVKAPFDVPGTGRVAIVEDSAGAVVGIMSPEPM